MSRELVAGTVYNFLVQAITYYGVAQQAYSDYFSAFLHSHNGEVNFIIVIIFIIFIDKKWQVPCELKESEKGKYLVTVKPIVSGLGMLTVKKDNVNILGSPWDLLILPGIFTLLFSLYYFFKINCLFCFIGPTKASNCEVIGMVDAMRCLPSVFYVVAKDSFANRKISGSDNVYSSISESIHYNLIIILYTFVKHRFFSLSIY